MSQFTEIKALINRLNVLYGSPETPDPRGFLREYESMLARYSPEVIRKAGDYIRDNHTRRSWPTPGEVRGALLAVAPAPSPVDWDAEEAERRKGWSLSDLGKAKIDDAAKARVQAMVDEMKRNFAANKVNDKPDSTEPNWQRGQRDGFLDMQRNSPNKAMHMTPDGLSRLSRRIMGDSDE